MIPKWQLVGLTVLVLATVALAVYASPNSYAHMFLTGRCFGDSVPEVCHPRGGRGGFGSGSWVTP